MNWVYTGAILLIVITLLIMFLKVYKARNIKKEEEKEKEKKEHYGDNIIKINYKTYELDENDINNILDDTNFI